MARDTTRDTTSNATGNATGSTTSRAAKPPGATGDTVIGRPAAPVGSVTPLDRPRGPSSGNLGTHSGPGIGSPSGLRPGREGLVAGGPDGAMGPGSPDDGSPDGGHRGDGLGGDAVVVALRRLVVAVDNGRAEVRHLFDRPRPSRRRSPAVRVIRGDGDSYRRGGNYGGGGDAA